MKRRLLPILFAFVFLLFWMMFRNPGGNPAPAGPSQGGGGQEWRQAPPQQPRAPQPTRPQGQRPPHPSGDNGWSMEEVETTKPKPPEASGWSIDTDAR